MNNARSLWLVLLLLVGIAAAYGRLETATTRPLWEDEVITLVAAELPDLSEVYHRCVQSFDSDTPFLYPVASWVLYHWLSPRWALRLTAVISGVATVVLLGLLGGILFGRRTGLIAAALIASSVYHINYSQDARAYALLACGTTAQFYFLVCYLRSSKKRHLVGWAVSSVISLYTHHFSVIYVLCGMAVAALFVLANTMRSAGGGKRRNNTAPSQDETEPKTDSEDALPDAVSPRRGPRTVLWRIAPPVLTLIAVAVVYAPGFATFIKFVSTPKTGDVHTLNLTGTFFTELIGRWGNGSQWSVIYAILLVLGLCSVLIRRDLTLACLLWLLVPFAIFGWVPFTHFFDIRYLIGSLPVFFLLVAEGICLLSRSWVLVDKRNSAAQGARVIRYADLQSLAVVAFMLCLSVPTYLAFRETKMRCSTFDLQPQVMTMDNGFCEKHLILNSLYEPHSFLLKPAADSDENLNR